jgi:hypothetical protein
MFDPLIAKALTAFVVIPVPAELQFVPLFVDLNTPLPVPANMVVPLTARAFT